MRRFINEGWKRTALFSCAVMLLSIVGAASQALSPRAIAAQLNGALLDGSLRSDQTIRNGQAGLRIAAERRQVDPGFDRAPPPDIVASLRLVEISTPDGLRVIWADTAVDSSSSYRVAHRPRGPPRKAPLSSRSSHRDAPAHELWNDGAESAHGRPSLMG